MEKFQCRVYGKSELAMKYCPYLSESAARRKLMSWIKMQPALVETLQRYGLKESSRSFTPIQVRLIVDAIGEP